MPDPVALGDRRAIEALRAGVPNRDAVRRLGCNHPRIEEQFRALLAGVESGFGDELQPHGLLVSGDFGSGKSHLLEYLQHVALEENFVCSKIVVSKETPISDPLKVFRAMVSEGRVPGKLGPSIQTLALNLKFDTKSYRDFYLWAGSEGSRIATRFPATLALFEYGRDNEYGQQIARFWAGDRLNTTQLKENLRQIGQLATYHLGSQPKARELAFQRIRFAPRLARAAGYRGWIVLFDELELIGRYAFKGRANAYAELARWLGRLDDIPDGQFPGLGTVAAITSDFALNVLDTGLCDREKIPNRLHASPREADQELAGLATRGIRLISNHGERLPALTAEQVKSAHDRLREAHSEAFGWDAPALADCFSPDSSSVMRPYIRRWITEWDLKRLYPDQPFDPVVDPLKPAQYNEDDDLEPTEPTDETER
jgi:hypothetical protein